MKFDFWPVLLLIIPVLLLMKTFYRRSLPARIHFPHYFPKDILTRSPRKWLMGLRYAAVLLLIIAFARPQREYEQTERHVSGIDIMMVMDVSQSMSIEDLGERPRFDIAKETIENFIKGRQNDRIGLVVFSGEPLTLAPLTLDYGLVLGGLRGMEMGILRDGTAIGDGLSLGIKNIRASQAKSKIIILLTDGDNNVGQVDPATAGDLAAGFGIKVYTIAIGTEGEVRMPIRQKSPLGNVITTYQTFHNALNPELLEKIAQNTNGRFYRVTDEGTLPKVFKEIDLLEKTEVKTFQKIKHDELFEKPLLLALLLLAVELLLARGILRTLP